MAALPIFVMGAPHSGTTILYRMLGLHPDVTWFSQFSCRDGSIPGRLRVPMMDRIESLLRRRPHTWMKRQTRYSRYVVPRPGEAKHVFEFALPVGAGISPDESARRLRRIFDAECRKWGRPAILLKWPRLYKQVALIRHAYPAAPFVHIIRDGRAVALSLQEKLIRRGRSAAQALERGAQVWLDAITALQPESAAGGAVELRYEDLCVDVHGAIRDALAFSGLSIERFPFERIPQTLMPTNDRWLKAASNGEMATLDRLLGDQLAAHGYR